jgi:UDP-glucose 4-epimerase
MKKTVLITGGAGFIGSHLAEKLVALKYKVIVIDNLYSGKKANLIKIKNKINFYKIDIRNNLKLEKIFKKKIDVVIHLAALADIVPSIQNPKNYYETNVTGTFNLLMLAKKYNIKKFIYSASSSCYGITKSIPTSENVKIDTRYPYALTKRLGEELILHWGNVFKLNYTSLRFFNVYGPRSRTSGAYGAMFGVFLAQKLSGKPFTIVANGKQKRDFTYVYDIVDSIVATMIKKKSKNQIFNVGSGNPVSVNYIAAKLKGRKVYIPKRPGEPDITCANVSKIKKFLNWKPKYSIDQGIELLLQDINYWKKAPVWSPSKIASATRTWFKYLS